MLYLEIKQLAKRKFSICQIAKQLKVSRTTVYKYQRMSLEEASSWINRLGTRKKKLDDYKDWIVAWLEEYPHLSAAQIKDWLLERYPNLQVGDSTTRLYVSQIREEYQIPKTRQIRHYEAVEEQPMGKQMQVDWGQTRQTTDCGKIVKLHFISFVLSHSRYKYVQWQDRPFTTRDAIRSHEDAFAYYGGMPEEIVYDQDNIIAVNENAGDLILTNEFQAYKQQRGFRVYLCKASDPESKGKIENVVKFIKYNFADSRKYSGIDRWNERCLSWLSRTGNYKVHQTIKKRPVEVFQVEKQHLQPVSYISLSEESCYDTSIARVVNKDNTVIYKANRYSVPLGTYRPGGQNKVWVEVQEGTGSKTFLIIKAADSAATIARHELSLGRGQLIKNNNHQRDHSCKIQALKESTISRFVDRALASSYINQLCQKYPRYSRDQLDVMQETIVDYPHVADASLEKCVNEALISANDFRDVAKYLDSQLDRQDKEIMPLEGPKRVLNIEVETRSLSSYVDILGGAAI